MSAVERIAHFLERETWQPGSTVDEMMATGCQADKQLVLTLLNATFCLSSSKQVTETSFSSENVHDGQTFQVGQFSFALTKGELLAVCGPVGCGKSTLINGIIGEAVKLPQSVVSKIGRTAFVPQSPFIMNTTLRENILFGRMFNQELYDNVIDGCCLRTDIAQLGVAKDMTEIGERGVTLSGGKFLLVYYPC
jgi:ABC-type transport system involved in cytochrome bd biosynthesis fused ATPase/permease subunit